MPLTFTYGANLGPAEVARHMPGQGQCARAAHGGEAPDAQKIHSASADVINAYALLDLPFAPVPDMLAVTGQ
ncbi:MAG: hypothetical protein M3Z75_14855 [Actinomycetota bacterium]|nr:hypothetical protein [Actinomycetota bacterium]